MLETIWTSIFLILYCLEIDLSAHAFHSFFFFLIFWFKPWQHQLYCVIWFHFSWHLLTDRADHSWKVQFYYDICVCGLYIGQSLRVSELLLLDIVYWCLVDTVNRTIFAWFFFFAFRDALWLLQWILGGRRKAAWKFFGSPLFQPLDDILHPLPVVFKADFSISVIERADFSHDPLQIHLLLACLPDVHWGGGTNISSGGGR